MMNQQTSNLTIEELTGEDLRAVKELEKTLASDFSWSASEYELGATIDGYDIIREQARHTLRGAIGAIYPHYIYVGARPKKRAAVLAACDSEGVTFKAGTHLAVVLVRLYMKWARVSGEAVNRYANVLREAAERRVAAGKLESYLAKKGQGINAMSRGYRDRKKKQANAGGGSVHQPRSSAATSSRAGGMANGNPTLDWSEKALKTWRLAKADTKLRFVVEKIDADRGQVVRESKSRTHEVIPS
jgi:hypothetical protein